MVVNSDTGERGFAKFLRRNGDLRARGRFHREVAAYETLALAGAPNLPRVLVHNGNEFKTGTKQLWLVLEPIDGCTLGEFVAANGPVDLPTALAIVNPLLTTLAICHSVGIVHRDIKPNNVMLRDGDPAQPLLVDFGLAFNSETDLDDLTRIYEDVGNRFLHLPEQSFNRRSPVGDITQAAGLLIYALTGSEPRILRDDNDQAPHQRPAESASLAALLTGGALRGLMSIFDKAFNSSSERRFHSVIEFHEALDGLADAGEVDPEPTYASLMARLEQETDSDAARELHNRHSLLNTLAADVSRRVDQLATERGLTRHQTGQSVDPRAMPPTSQTSVALTGPTTLPANPSEYITYIFELHGPDIVLLVDGAPVWRGQDPGDQQLHETVLLTAMERYFASNQ